MLLRGIAAGMAARVSRALTSAVVHDNAIPSNSGQSRTSSVIGVIFLAATLAALSRTGTAWGAEQTTHEQDHPLSIGSSRWNMVARFDLRGGLQGGRHRSVRSRANRPVYGRSKWQFFLSNYEYRRPALRGQRSITSRYGRRRHCRSHDLFRDLRRERTEPQAHAAFGVLPVSKLR
jgi:hypothetical protein